MRNLKYVVTVVAVVLGTFLVWQGCNSDGPLDSDMSARLSAQPAQGSQDGVTCVLDGYSARAYDLYREGSYCSARVRAFGSPEIDGHYTFEIQGDTDEASARSFRLGLTDEHGSLFGMSFTVEGENERYVIREYTNAETVGIVYERSESGWTMEYSDSKGVSEVFEFSVESLDQLIETAVLYDDLMRESGSDISSADVSPEDRLLLEEYARAKAILAGASAEMDAVLSSNSGAQLMGDLFDNDDFVVWLENGLMESKYGQQPNLAKFSEFCDVLAAATELYCFIRGDGDRICEIMIRVVDLCYAIANLIE